jgi:transposase
LNLSYKKCDIKPWNCPDKEKQEEMINKLKAIKKQCKKWKAKMLFEDAVHQLHTTSTWYAIQFKWKANTKFLQSNTGRNRLTILGTIDPYNWEFISVQTKQTCNIEFMKLLLKTIADKYKDRIKSWKKIYLILDNARYQKAYEVQDYAKELWISLQYLPPYCPHLNIIERLRKRMKKKLKNIYFPTFEIFCNHILDILSSIEKSYEELKWILRLRFWII